ncbi:MAG: hypothetical protein V4670_05055 [Bacteroidota bacterium]
MEEARKKIDIGTTINNAIEIFKKTYLVSGFAFLFMTVFLMTLGIIGLEYFIGLEKAAEMLKTFDPANLSINGTFIYFGCMLLFSVLIAPFNAGLLKIMKDADDEKEISFSSLFYYVNSSYYVRIIGLTLILVSLNFILNIGIQKIITDKSIGGIISTIFSVALSILTFVSLPNIIFKDFGVIDAIKNSVTLTQNNVFQIILLIVIALVIGYAGLILFCIGLFFTFPIYYAMQYAIYKNLN